MWVRKEFIGRSGAAHLNELVGLNDLNKEAKHAKFKGSRHKIDEGLWLLGRENLLGVALEPIGSPDFLLSD